MRRFIFAASLLLSACATRPEQAAAPTSTPPAAPSRAGALIGFTAAQLIGEFGNPALQVREGSSIKLQFRRPSCVLDAYLYPTAGGPAKVTHVDTRLPSGADSSQAACIAALEARS